VTEPHGPAPPGVLYVIVCGSPVARDVTVLVDLAQNVGWDVCVITTPDGRKFVDPAVLKEQTGHPVRTTYKNPGDDDVLPAPDAIIVAPATVNTVNKWAAGIADTLALGLLIEGYGLGLPIIVVPYTNAVMAMHPTLAESLTRLSSWGVDVLFGDHVVRLHPPGTGDRYRDLFPWRQTFDRLQLRWAGPTLAGPASAGPEAGGRRAGDAADGVVGGAAEVAGEPEH
jgi:phosphopantothenoylcysteine decarboxylase